MDLPLRPLALGDVDGGDDDLREIVLVPRHHRPTQVDVDGFARQGDVAAFPIEIRPAFCHGVHLFGKMTEPAIDQVIDGHFDQLFLVGRAIHLQRSFVQVEHDDLFGALCDGFGMVFEVFEEIDHALFPQHVDMFFDLGEILLPE